MAPWWGLFSSANQLCALRWATVFFHASTQQVLFPKNLQIGMRVAGGHCGGLRASLMAAGSVSSYLHGSENPQATSPRPSRLRKINFVT